MSNLQLSLWEARRQSTAAALPDGPAGISSALQQLTGLKGLNASLTQGGLELSCSPLCRACTVTIKPPLHLGYIPCCEARSHSTAEASHTFGGYAFQSSTIAALPASPAQTSKPYYYTAHLRAGCPAGILCGQAATAQLHAHQTQQSVVAWLIRAMQPSERLTLIRQSRLHDTSTRVLLP